LVVSDVDAIDARTINPQSSDVLGIVVLTAQEVVVHAGEGRQGKVGNRRLCRWSLLDE